MKTVRAILLLLIGIVCWFDVAIAVQVLPQFDDYYRNLPPGAPPALSLQIAVIVTRYMYAVVALVGALALGLHYWIRSDRAKTWTLAGLLVLMCACGGITFLAQWDLPWDIGFGPH